MGRRYVAPVEALSVAQSAAVELWFVKAPSDAVVVLHEVVVTQDASETSEQLPLEIFRTATDQSAKGSSITPAPLESGDAAFSGTVRSNILTGDTFATKTTALFRQSQNVLGGWHMLWTPETRPVVSPSGQLVVKLPVGPGAALTVSGYIVFEEIGG
jgi:hypothetical protein